MGFVRGFGQLRWIEVTSDHVRKGGRAFPCIIAYIYTINRSPLTICILEGPTASKGGATSGKTLKGLVVFKYAESSLPVTGIFLC